MTRRSKETEHERVERLLDELDPDVTPAIDTTALAWVAQSADLHKRVEKRLTQAVLLARAEGFSWSDIGLALRVSRQAARQKYGPLEKTT